MCFDYDGQSEVWNVSIPVARKSHTCCSCKRMIERGEQYVSIRWVYESRAGTYKLCNQCEQDRCTIREHEYADGCDGLEAECPLDEIRSYMRDSGLAMATEPINLRKKATQQGERE